jgi:hypothetical protein
MIPAFGFGATIPPYTTSADHCFALNGDIFNPECDGIEGVAKAYKNAINRVNLYGPTHFASFLELITDMTEDMKVTHSNKQKVQYPADHHRRRDQRHATINRSNRACIEHAPINYHRRSR